MNITQNHILIFRALSHPTRIEILKTLVDGPVCVCELGGAIGKRQPNISQHLAILSQAGLVTRSRDGLNIYYHLNDARLKDLAQVIASLAQRDHPGN